MAEDRIRRFLTEKRLSAFRAFLAKEHARDFMDEKLYAMKDVLEKDFAIECIFLAYLDRGTWRRAKEFTRSIGHPISDGTFRARMIELEHRGLLCHEYLDPLKKQYHMTDFGRSIASLLLELLERLEKLGLL